MKKKKITTTIVDNKSFPETFSGIRKLTRDEYMIFRQSPEPRIIVVFSFPETGEMGVGSMTMDGIIHYCEDSSIIRKDNYEKD